MTKIKLLHVFENSASGGQIILLQRALLRTNQISNLAIFVPCEEKRPDILRSSQFLQGKALATDNAIKEKLWSMYERRQSTKPKFLARKISEFEKFSVLDGMAIGRGPRVQIPEGYSTKPVDWKNLFNRKADVLFFNHKKLELFKEFLNKAFNIPNQWEKLIDEKRLNAMHTVHINTNTPEFQKTLEVKPPAPSKTLWEKIMALDF